MKRTHKAIARLASLKAQERYIVRASAEEYYLPEELLDSALEALDHEASGSMVSKLIAQINTIVLSDRLVPGELIYQYQPWVKLRDLATEYLHNEGFNLKAWEENEL